MEKFIYEISKYPAEALNQLVFFCSEKGECRINQVPHDQTKILEELLNEQGAQGWELIQLFFGKDGVIAFWKRRLQDKK